jgi:hypothetical protein
MEGGKRRGITHYYLVFYFLFVVSDLDAQRPNGRASKRINEF